MDYVAFQNFLADWFKDVTDLPAVHWDAPNTERPDYPYGVLTLLSEDDLGQDETSYELVSGVLQPTISGNRIVTVTLKTVTNTNKPPNHARGYLAKAFNAMGKDTTVDAFSAAGIAIVDQGAVIGFNTPRNLGIVSVAAFDLRLAITISESDTANSYIAQAQVSGEVKTPATITFGPDTYGEP